MDAIKFVVERIREVRKGFCRLINYGQGEEKNWREEDHGDSQKLSLRQIYNKCGRERHGPNCGGTSGISSWTRPLKRSL